MRWSSFCVALALLCACGEERPASPADSDSSEAGLNPCGLLTRSQVSTVLPGADEGYVAARGGSLVEGIDSYQCSYADEGGNMLLVVFHVAATEQLFDDIKPKDPSWRAGEANVESVALGDGGWFERRDDGVKLQASRGHLVIEVSLDAPEADEKRDSVIALGQNLLDVLPS